MTSLATGGTATTLADNSASGEGVAQAFDSSPATKWLTFAATGWIQYCFGGGRSYAVTYYSLTAGADTSAAPGRAPKNWSLLGSADGVNWSTLDTQVNQADTVGGHTRSFAVSQPVAFNYYRLNITASNGDNILQLAELGLYGPSGQSQASTTSLAIGGTATTLADNSASGEGVAQAFDSSPATKWLTFAATGWIQYCFGGGRSYAVTYYSLTAGADTSAAPGRAPKNWSLLGSADGVNWSTLDTQVNQADTVGGHTRSFAVSQPVAFNYYRLNITASNGDNILQLAELGLYGPSGQSGAPTSLATGGTATTLADNSASGEGVAQAFDSSPATKWLTFAATGWIQYCFGGGRSYAVTYYSLTAGADTSAAPGRAPKNWSLLGSADGVNWSTLDTQVNQADTVGGHTRSFAVSQPVAFNYYRLNITASNGDNILQLAELGLYAAPMPPKTQ